MEQGVVWTSGRGCTVSGGLVGGGFWDAYAIAASMLGLTDESHLLEKDPEVLFARVKDLAVDRIENLQDSKLLPYFSIYPGPLHMASLLSATAKDLKRSAIVNIEPPNGVNAVKWKEFLRRMAERRPYLWQNHRHAVNAGYLEPGTSASISFPTGAGKSTLSELKIAAAHLRGVKVVFLAPTLALVDQTARAIEVTFPQAGLQRQMSEEFVFGLENDTLDTISVMTPERCLAMMSIDRDIFSEVGLLIFDECHLMHVGKPERSRRAIDSMLCILNFISISPKMDMLFLSAMMKNCAEIAGWVSDMTGRTCLSLALSWKPTRQVRGCIVYEKAEIDHFKSRLQNVRGEVPNKNAPAFLVRELLVGGHPKCTT